MNFPSIHISRNLYDASRLSQMSETQWALQSFQEESLLHEESEFSFGIEGYIFTLQRN